MVEEHKVKANEVISERKYSDTKCFCSHPMCNNYFNANYRRYDDTFMAIDTSEKFYKGERWYCSKHKEDYERDLSIIHAAIELYAASFDNLRGCGPLSKYKGYSDMAIEIDHILAGLIHHVEALHKHRYGVDNGKTKGS